MAVRGGSLSPRDGFSKGPQLYPIFKNHQAGFIDWCRIDYERGTLGVSELIHFTELVAWEEALVLIRGEMVKLC